jgi:hypothetical protein
VIDRQEFDCGWVGARTQEETGVEQVNPEYAERILL